MINWIIGTLAVRVQCAVFQGLVQYVNKRLLVVIIIPKVETNLLDRNSRAFRDVKFVLYTRVEQRRLPSPQLVSSPEPGSRGTAGLSCQDGWRWMETGQGVSFLHAALASMSHIQISCESGRYLKCTQPAGTHTVTFSTLTYISFKERRAKPEGYV